MTETTRTTECNASAATLYLAFELGSTKWVLAFTSRTATSAAADAADCGGGPGRAAARNPGGEGAVSVWS